MRKVDSWRVMSKPSEGEAKESQQINRADGWKGTKKRMRGRTELHLY